MMQILWLDIPTRVGHVILVCWHTQILQNNHISIGASLDSRKYSQNMRASQGLAFEQTFEEEGAYPKVLGEDESQDRD
jgi:hypothetical protein